MTQFRKRLLSACAALALGLSTVTVIAPPAHAITVFDPSNYSQNLLTGRPFASSRLTIKFGRSPTRRRCWPTRRKTSPTCRPRSPPDLQSSLRAMDQLILDAQGIAYQVSQIDSTYRRLFPEEYASAVSTSQIVQDAHEAWRLARGGFQHSLEVQAGVVNQVRSDALV